MNKITDISGGPCSFCHKRPAARLCDAPIGTQRFVGHPPRFLAAYHPDHLSWNIPRVITCDRPMCDACAVEIIPGVDYCPDCIKRIIARASEKAIGREK